MIEWLVNSILHITMKAHKCKCTAKFYLYILYYYYYTSTIFILSTVLTDLATTLNWKIFNIFYLYVVWITAKISLVNREHRKVDLFLAWNLSKVWAHNSPPRDRIQNFQVLRSVFTHQTIRLDLNDTDSRFRFIPNIVQWLFILRNDDYFISETVRINHALLSFNVVWNFRFILFLETQDN